MSHHDRRQPLRLVDAPARSVAGKLPPNDLPAERGVLGACIVDGSKLERVSNILEPKDFYADQHKKIFAAMLALAAAGKPIDPVSLRAQLDQEGRLSQVGGASYLLELMNEPSMAATIEHHAGVIAEHAVNRAFTAAMQEAQAEIYFAPGTTTRLWRDQVVARLNRVAQGRVSSGMVSIRDAAQATTTDVAKHERGTLMGLATGFEQLDKATGGLIAPQIYLVGGDTGGGKSAFAHCVAMNVARGPGPRRGVAVFSLEMLAKEMSARCACAMGRIDWKRIVTGAAEGAELTRYFGALQEVGELPIEIDEDSSLTPLRMRGKLRSARSVFERDGEELALGIVDYVQLMSPDDGGEDNTEKQLSAIGKALKLTAELFKIPIIVLTQLTEGKPRDCKALEYHAPNFWIVEHHRRRRPMIPGVSDLPSDARVKIAKGRFVGDGSASTYFHKRFTLFTDEAV